MSWQPPDDMAGAETYQDLTGYSYIQTRLRIDGQLCIRARGHGLFLESCLTYGLSSAPAYSLGGVSRQWRTLETNTIFTEQNLALMMINIQPGFAK
jgi:hypothetical protein